MDRHSRSRKGWAWWRWAAAMLAVLVLWTTTGRALDLAGFTFAYPPAKALTNPTHLADGVKSYAFCSSVGGVAFGAVAKGDKGYRVASLKYDRKRPDGQRLQVVLLKGRRRRRAAAAIYDWQLAPIAKFAATDQHSCFTLFGELQNPAEERARRARGEKIMNYHPAMENTLLGLRLFQADILILYSESCDLPREQDGYVLGAGEAAPDVEANQRSLGRLHALLQRLPGGPFQSYIICDHGVQVNFTRSKGKLVLTGDPVWHCWKSKTRDRAQLDAIQDKANAEANAVLNAAYQRDSAAMGPAKAREKYTEAYRRQVHHREFDRVLTDALLVTMPKYSQSLSREIRNLGGINPTVYASLATTLRYAAFFRHAKQADPEGYAAFMDSLPKGTPMPAVRTPTVLIRPR